MKEIFIDKFKCNVKILNIGDFYATGQKEGIATVLGSCIAACLYEEGGGIGGMNHFLVPGDFRDEEIFLSPIARYGMFAMELLLGELIKLNADRARLRAKVFGGADNLAGAASTTGIGANNVKFIKTFLKMEDIPIESINVGGGYARKVFFFPGTGKVLLKRITANVNKIVDLEAHYKQKLELEI
ncbi:MAG: chemoreceptor glutamine deamidase CheD [bacterium]|nr:chemoreceptor glutamine deamidase CheD [bacterium]